METSIMLNTAAQSAEKSNNKLIGPLIEMVHAVQLAANPPEWMRQHMLVRRGEATWDDWSFEEKTCKGWLWPYLLQCDSQPSLAQLEHDHQIDFDRSKIPSELLPALRGGSGRWNWWMEAHARGRLPQSDIPQIEFLSHPDPGTMKMLHKCLDVDWNYRLPDFLDWILWGFGEGDERPRVDDKTNEKWYRLFDLSMMAFHPTDYWGELYSETKGRGSWNRTGFYPTPHCVCKAMIQIVGHDERQAAKENGIDTRLLSGNEPCCGTGRMLMEMSNLTVNLSGMDIDSVCIAATKINGYLYVPWMVRPAAWVHELRNEQIEASNQSSENVIAKIIKKVNPEYQVEFNTTTKTGIHRFKIKSGPAKRTQFKVKELNVIEFRKQYEKAVRKALKAKAKKNGYKQVCLWDDQKVA
jgi:hypothetical protein